MTTDWNPLLRDQFEQPYWSELMSFVDAERDRYPVYPPREEVFAALHHTSFREARVVILGQDPYHGAGQAHGLCFSVRRGVPKPPSVANIHRELHDDLGLDPPDHGNLEAWAANGVLLLNTTLTVRAGKAGSHRGRGWERFTDRVIEVVSGRDTPIVFVLWGSAAREKRSMIDTSRHAIVESTHPS
ncbi:MAG: uracil-DNA glycosylase, partial [Ilumatobacter sp.]